MSGSWLKPLEVGPGPTAEEWSRPVTLFMAARALAEKERMAREQLARQNRLADLQEQRQQEVHALGVREANRRMAVLDAANERDARKAKFEEFKRQQEYGPKAIGMLDTDPDAAKRTLEMLGYQDIQQVTPQRPMIPSLTAPSPELKKVLAQGSSLADIETAGTVPGAQAAHFERPPSQEEFQKYAGRKGEGFNAPPQYGEQGEEGPFTPDQQALLRAREAARSPEYVAAAKDYLAQRQAALDEDATYKKRLAESEAHPTFKGLSPTGQIEHFDPQAQFTKAHDRILSMAESETDPLKRNMLTNTAGLVDKRILTPDQADDWIKMLYQEQNKNDRAATTAHRPSPAWASFGLRQDEAKLNRTRTDFEHALKNRGLDKAVDEYSQLSWLKEGLSSANPDTQQAALVALARMKQGDNRFSNQDMQVLVDQVGGQLNALETKIRSWVDSGRRAPEVITFAKGTVDTLEKVLRNRHREAASTLGKQFGDSKRYDFDYFSSLASDNIPNYDELVASGVAPPPPPKSGKRTGPPGADAARKTAEEQKTLEALR